MKTENEIYETHCRLSGIAEMLQMVYEYVEPGDNVNYLVINNNLIHWVGGFNYTSDAVKDLNELLARNGLLLMVFENKSILTDLDSFALNKDSVTAFVNNI